MSFELGCQRLPGGVRLTGLVPEVIMHLERHDWTVSDALRCHLNQVFQTFGGTQLIEDGFKRERDLERKNTNKLTSCSSKWAQLIDSNLVSTVHDMVDIDWGSEAAPRSCLKHAGELVFTPSQKRAPKCYKDITGKSSTTAWYSPQPLFSVQPDLDLALIVEIAEVYNSNWQVASNMWWVWLLKNNQPMLIRHQKRHSKKQWFFALDIIGGCCGIAWPADVVRLGGCEYFVVSSSPRTDRLELCFVLQHEDWLAMRVSSRSQLHMSLKHKKVPAHTFPGIVAEPIETPAKILVIAARAAFWDLGWTQMKRIATELRVDPSGSPDMFDLVKACMTKVLGGSASASEIADMMKQRVLAKDLLSELIISNEGADLLELDKQQADEDYRAEVTRAEADRKSYAARVVEYQRAC